MTHLYVRSNTVQCTFAAMKANICQTDKKFVNVRSQWYMVDHFWHYSMKRLHYFLFFLYVNVSLSVFLTSRLIGLPVWTRSTCNFSPSKHPVMLQVIWTSSNKIIRWLFRKLQCHCDSWCVIIMCLQGIWWGFFHMLGVFSISSCSVVVTFQLPSHLALNWTDGNRTTTA